MSLQIEKNKKDLYRIKSSISDELISEKEWVTEQEAKKALILREWYNFVEKAVEIEMDFPGGYIVNDKRVEHDRKGLKFIGECLNTDASKIDKKFQEICKNLEIDFSWINA